MEIINVEDTKLEEPIETVLVNEEQPLYYIWRESDNRYQTYSYEEPEHDCWTLAKPMQFCPPEFPYWDKLQESWYLKTL